MANKEKIYSRGGEQFEMETYLKWAYIVAGCIVFTAIFRDIMQRRISIYLLAVGSLLSVLLRIVLEAPLKEGIAGCIPGMIFLICGYISRRAIGYGDGWMFMITGMCIGIREIILVLSICLVLIAVYGLFAIVIRKKSRKTAVAVMPWLFFSLLIGSLI